MEENSMVEEKSWDEFRSFGLLWWINMILHTFGWSIVTEIDEETGEVKRAYPARVKYRGFSENVVEDGYRKVSRFMVDNAETLSKEAEE